MSAPSVSVVARRRRGRRVVDQDVDRPEFVQAATGHLGRRVVIAQIGGDDERLVVEGAGHLLQLVATAGDQCHPGAGPVERLRGRRADATRGSGDERVPTFEGGKHKGSLRKLGPGHTGPRRWLGWSIRTESHPAPPRPTAYDERVSQVREQYAAIPAGPTVRLAKRTSNLFRPRPRRGGPGLDVKAFDGVIEVDAQRPHRRRAGYDHLRASGRRHPGPRADAHGGAGAEDHHPRRGDHRAGHRELVVSQRDAPRVGHRDGHPDRRREVVTARPDSEHRELFYGFPNSYGTLGYALRVRIELEAVQPVRPPPPPARSRRCRDARSPSRSRLRRAGRYRGEAVDFVDGTVFPRRVLPHPRVVGGCGPRPERLHRTPRSTTGRSSNATRTG